jgi:hypothetical protein
MYVKAGRESECLTAAGIGISSNRYKKEMLSSDMQSEFRIEELKIAVLTLEY